MPRRSASSGRWLAEHESDAYVARARAEGWRSRAVFKLEAMDKRDGLVRAGQRIVDLGAAPGGWTQYCARRFPGRLGALVAIDILPMEPIDGAHVLTADFREDAALAVLEQALQGSPVDLVLSDMAPNMSGVRAVDQPASLQLVELAEDFAVSQLRPGGDFVTKAFQGEGFDELLKRLRSRFEKVALRKPLASRARSREVYIVARSLRDE